MRRRIVVRAVLAAVLAIGLFAVPMAAGVARYFQNDERAELERIADTAALAVADDLSGDTTTPVLPSTDPEARVSLYSPTAVRITGTGPETADAVVRRAATRGQVSSGDDDGDLLVAVPIFDRGRLTGVVRGSTTTTEVIQRTALIWAGMLALAVLAIGATWLFARRMAAHLARPLERLATAP